jgi:hypothetical protein
MRVYSCHYERSLGHAEDLPRLDISKRQSEGDGKEESTSKRREAMHLAAQKW